ncbi:MAG: hypothetical protein ACI83Y_001909 [Candidatus Azotimanducaceae bacterium]|jgi:hypothetical protein|tara:strand:+ start:496 stop:759 length:264 start_codon:yes stop_codon:yes gene_type:complete
MTRLDRVDLSAPLQKDEYEERLAAGQQRFEELRLHLGEQTNEGSVGPGLVERVQEHTTIWGRTRARIAVLETTIKRIEHGLDLWDSQ